MARILHDATAAFGKFVQTYELKFLKATLCLEEYRDELLAESENRQSDRIDVHDDPPLLGPPPRLLDARRNSVHDVHKIRPVCL